MRSLVAMLLWLAAFAPSASAQLAPTAAQWREDLRTLAERLPRVHVDAFHAISREEWARRVETLDRAIPGMSRHQIEIGLMSLVAAIGDGHTSLSPFYLPQLGFHAVPLRFYAFSDGIFVRAADSAHGDLVGARLKRVGRLSVEEAFARVSATVSHDNEQGLKLVVPLYFCVAEVLNGLDIVPGDTEISYELEKGGKTFSATVPATMPLGHAAHGGGAIWVDPPGWVDARDSANAPTPLWLKDPQNLYRMEYLATSKTLYVQYNGVSNKPDEPIAAFFRKVYEFAETHPVERFVIDLRHNQGGDAYYNTPVVSGLLRARLDARGTLFVLIGRSTFSAAQNLVNDLSKYTKPTCIGEPTSSRPNQYGDHEPISLPHSGLVVMASTFFHQDAGKHDHRPWTAPHLPAPLSFAEYRRNQDPAMDVVIRYRSIGKALNEAAEAGDPAKLETVYRAFRADPATSWIDTEREVNDLGYELIGLRKLPLAVRLFRLNVDSRPGSVNAHDSLGEAYLAEGKIDLARAEYRRVLELSPGNENAGRMLKEIERRASGGEAHP